MAIANGGDIIRRLHGDGRIDDNYGNARRMGAPLKLHR